MKIIINKKFKIIVICFIIVQFVVRLLLYKPIKMCTFESLLNDTKYYIVCEYVEVTGFFWRIIHDSEGNISNVYVKLTGTDFNDEGTNYFTDSILHSGCKFVFYGNYIDNSLNSDFNRQVSPPPL